MLKKIGRILLGVLLISLMILSMVYVILHNNQKSANRAGTITFIVNNMDNQIVEKKRIEYKKDDTLFEVLNSLYTIEYKETGYGHYLIGIQGDSFNIKTNGTSTWLWFELCYIKDGVSYKDTIDFNDYVKQTVSTGIDGIELKDNMIFAINERDNLHNTSMFNDSISFNSYYNSIKAFRIIVYVMLGIFLIAVVVFLIASRKSDHKITVRELCILAFMSVLLFVQEELLVFIPNFQFTFLLLAVYVSQFGFKKTSLIVFAHVLLDNIYMGSLTPIVMIPMWLGYMIYIGIIWLLKNKNIWLLTLGAILGAYIYSMLFLVTNIVFLKINVYLYWIADIPFEIMLISTIAFTMIYLYKPLSRKLGELWNKDNEVYIEDNGEII